MRLAAIIAVVALACCLVGCSESIGSKETLATETLTEYSAPEELPVAVMRHEVIDPVVTKVEMDAAGHVTYMSGMTPFITGVIDADKAYDALCSLRELCGIDKLDYVLVSEDHSFAHTYVFMQDVDGYPLYDGRFTLICTEGGTLTEVSGSYKDVSRIPATFDVSLQDARETATRTVAGTVTEEALALNDDEDGYVWQFTIDSANPNYTDAIVCVDAQTGEVARDEFVPIAG